MAMKHIIGLHGDRLLVKRSTSHLSGLKDMPHDFSHFWRLFRSSCSSLVSSGLIIVRYNSESSAKSLVVDDTHSGRSFIKTRKSRGPRTDPCETPEDWHETCPSSSTRWVRFDKKF